MCPIILILQLVIGSGFSELFKYLTRAEPNLDLECLNDYITGMVCRLTPDQLDRCSEYSLDVFKYHYNVSFECNFKLNSDTCECSLQVQSGFLVGENYRVNVLRRKKLLFTENVSTTKSIKPIKPAIVSVNQTQNGNYVIVWDTVYRIKQPIFSNELIPELIYCIDGGNKCKKIESLAKGQGDYELIGRNLESNSNYIVKARVKFDLNSRFSDYSEPYTFTTHSSLKDVLKIIIPVICIILIITILGFYYFYNKILTNWWDKVPTPKIATRFVKQVPNLLSFQNEFSPVHLDSSKLVHAGEKTWPAYSLVDDRGDDSLVKDGNSADVIYGQTANKTLKETSTENADHWEVVKDLQTTNMHQIAMSSKYKNLKSNSDVEMEYGNSSGISNKFYMLSFSDKFFNPPCRNVLTDFGESENLFPALPRNLEPTVMTDFEYSPCPSTCTGSENTGSLHHLTPSSNDIIMIPEYQSVSEVNCTPTDQAFVSSHNDFNLIMDQAHLQQEHAECVLQSHHHPGRERI